MVFYKIVPTLVHNHKVRDGGVSLTNYPNNVKEMLCREKYKDRIDIKENMNYLTTTLQMAYLKWGITYKLGLIGCDKLAHG